MRHIRIFFQILLTGVLFIVIFGIFWFIIGVLEELVVRACHIQQIQSSADLNWLGTFVMLLCIVITYHGARDITFLMVRKLFPDLTLQVCVNYLERISYNKQKCVEYVDSAVEKICKRDLKDRDEVLKSYGIFLKQTSDDTFIEFGEKEI